jgi:hypothetical protein
MVHMLKTGRIWSQKKSLYKIVLITCSIGAPMEHVIKTQLNTCGLSTGTNQTLCLITNHVDSVSFHSNLFTGFEFRSFGLYPWYMLLLHLECCRHSLQACTHGSFAVTDSLITLCRCSYYQHGLCTGTNQTLCLITNHVCAPASVKIWCKYSNMTI